MSADPISGEWLIVVVVQDRPGATAAIASSFAGQGLQIESFLAIGSPETTHEANTGIVAVSFRSSRKLMEHFQARLARLETVISVRAYDRRTGAGKLEVTREHDAEGRVRVRLALDER